MDNGSNRKTLAALCALAVIVSVAGIWYAASGLDRVYVAVQTKPAAVSRLWLDYTDSEGRPQHVEVTSKPGESQHELVVRLHDAVTEQERQFPRR